MSTMTSWTDVTSLLFCTLFLSVLALDYSDLEALGLACPKRDKCDGYREDETKTYLDRSCECDPKCHAYRDCCIDVKKKSGQQVSQSDFECLHYGDNVHSGVYGLTRCGRDWNGPAEIREKCEGPLDISDPLSASPVTSRHQNITYRNLYCAECNEADKGSLQFFEHKLACEGLQDTPKEEIMKNIAFDRRKKKWGVRVRSEGRVNSTFVECQIIFDVPTYLNKSVRFCRANIISKCARNWTRPMVKKSCQEYMSVVYDKDRAYRNPHCAICNHKVTSELSCSTDLLGRKRPFSFSDLIDINRPDKEECPAGHILDPYSKRCRKLACALPGYVVQNNRCVKGG